MIGHSPLADQPLSSIPVFAFTPAAVGDPVFGKTYDNPVRLPYASVFLGFVAASSIALTTIVYVPRAPTSVQVGTRAVQQPGQLPNLLPGLLSFVAPTRIFGQYDWPVPSQRLVQQPGQLPNLLPGLLSFVAPTRIFGQYDWPVPSQRLVQQPGQQSNLLTSTLSVAASKPFAQTEWPVPSARAVQQPDLTQRFVGYLQKPFAQTEWPVPSARAVQQPGNQPNLQGTLLAVAAKPFAQYDWPNPSAKRYLLEMPFSRLTPAQLIAAITSSGALVCQSATLSGTAKSTSLTTDGTIAAAAATVVGTSKSSSKTTDGTIVAQAASVFGIAQNGPADVGGAQTVGFLADVGKV
jgi:hypothetical protein